MGFRYFAVRAARGLGLVGTVRNMPDGTVEAVAEGERDKLSRFRKELETGPSYSRVTSVNEIEMSPLGRFTSFDVIY